MAFSVLLCRDHCRQHSGSVRCCPSRCPGLHVDQAQPLELIDPRLLWLVSSGVLLLELSAAADGGAYALCRAAAGTGAYALSRVSG